MIKKALNCSLQKGHKSPNKCANAGLYLAKNKGSRYCMFNSGKFCNKWDAFIRVNRLKVARNFEGIADLVCLNIFRESEITQQALQRLDFNAVTECFTR